VTRPALSDLSPRFQAQAVAQLHGTPHPRTVKIEVAPQPPAKKRIRQNASGLNKTEAAFEQWAKAGGIQFAQFYSQAVTLRIANGCRYTPDFIATGAVWLRAYEVKGFMRDDAAVKLKVAASLYPWITFHLVSKRKGGGWDVQKVLA
jgi:hypothetical protein